MTVPAVALAEAVVASKVVCLGYTPYSLLAAHLAEVLHASTMVLLYIYHRAEDPNTYTPGSFKREVDQNHITALSHSIKVH